MEKLQLALLTQWAEDAGLRGIEGRKRMQKVIYFLQQVGCPIDAEYTLHHYGPYSRDVANVTDMMVAEGLLHEQGGGGEQYEYRLSELTRQMIAALSIRKGSLIAEFERYQESALTLLREDIWTLELGSTISFYFKQKNNGDWDLALRDACAYKRADATGQDSLRALELAKRFCRSAA